MIRRLNDRPQTDLAEEIDAIRAVEQVLQEAIALRASDVHLEPIAAGLEVRFRIDGLLETRSTHPPTAGRMLIARLMVLGKLLTYRTDIPQEGRLQIELESGSAVDLRLAIMPTTHGLRAAIRMPAELLQPGSIEELNLPEPALAGLHRFAAAVDSGMLLVIGPAGAGKTTTIYALLQSIAARFAGLSIISLEDPVEWHVAGVTQIEISPFGQMTYERALRSILRQDPQVLMLGEIRDAQTASLAAQAALTGHRLICTLHAASAGAAVARLLEMGLEPYRVTSAISGVLSQRLLRKSNPREPGRYSGRVPAAEFVEMSEPIRRAILDRADSGQIQRIASGQPGYQSLRDCAQQLVERGWTDQAEVLRVLGPGETT